MMIVTGISGSHVVMNFGERSQDPETMAHIHGLIATTAALPRNSVAFV
jgi:hypothetical protein